MNIFLRKIHSALVLIAVNIFASTAYAAPAVPTMLVPTTDDDGNPCSESNANLNPIRYSLTSKVNEHLFRCNTK